MDILTFSKSVPDCRDEKNRLYDASELVFISLVAVLCGSETWNEIEEFCEYNFKYFKERLPNLCGVPSHDTLNRFFSVLDISWFERAFRDWVSDICEQISGVVAIDLGQEKVNAKSNEITAIPRLIDALDLRGCIVTIDAIGCQKSIANAIVKAGADYVLCVKENQKELRRIVAFNVREDRKETEGYCKWCEQSNEGHGRKEWRECVCCDFEKLARFFLKGWTGVRTLARVTARRQTGEGEMSEETRYYITSLPDDPELILKSVRSHWSIENQLHWRMDVAFREDFTRKTNNAAINFSALGKMALMMLKSWDKKVGIASKRKFCGWNEETRDIVLGIKKQCQNY